MNDTSVATKPTSMVYGTIMSIRRFVMRDTIETLPEEYRRKGKTVS
jgi:hypothetical protein